MRKKSIITLCFVVIIAIALDLVAILGLPGSLSSKYGGMLDSETGIRQGIDLAGGSVITFQAQSDNPSDAEMETVKSIYETRLNGAGYTEARISVGEGGKVTIEIPSGGSSTDDAEVSSTDGTATADDTATAEDTAATDDTAAADDTATAEGTAAADETAAEGEMSATEETDAAVELLSQVAKLTFRDSDNNVVLEGTDVSSAQSIYGKPSENANSQYYVQVEFTADGAKKFAEATGKAAAKASPNNIIQIVMDDTVVSAPRVQEKIDSTSCVITGDFDAETASMLANQINSGNLPFEMKKISQETVGAELGRDALPTSLLAAAIGIILVMLFMIWRYRIPGLIADLALLVYIGLICLAMGVFRVNLSLSGIAGIVLSIGMAVDANCIIFERMKEEMALGKSIRASVEAGFNKAFSAILDSNITTIISCVVLYLSGIGTVTGFATTLGIGVILSMFTAIVVTKFLLRNLVNIGIRNRSLFVSDKYIQKANDETKKVFGFAAHKLKFLILPVVIIAVGIAMYFVHGGFNFDIEFNGGIRMQVAMNQSFDNDEIAKLVKDETGLDAVVQKSGTTNDIAIIKLPATDAEDNGEANKDTVFAAMQEKYNLDDEALLSVQSASPSFGKEVQSKALSFTLLAILCMLAYIIIRFDWRSGIMAVVTLTINVLVMCGVYTTTNIAINTTFIAAMLTVVGYSINNTIVIFDRVRENSKARRRSESITAMVNRSIAETMGRTVNSTVTTLITIVLIYIIGVTSIKQFALPLIIGIVIGAYTSIFLASTFWAAWKEHEAAAKAELAAAKRAEKKNK